MLTLRSKLRNTRPRLFLKIVVQLLEMQACYFNIAYLRNIDISGAVDGRMDVEIDLTPNPDSS